MRDDTAAALDLLNHDFYEARGKEFDTSRHGSWPGWKSLAAVTATRASGRPLAVADLGCGNGRFATFLDEAGIPANYVGLERSWILARACSQRLSSRQTATGSGLVVLGDLLRHPGWLQPQEFDLVVCFGVLHHVPGLERRRELVRSAFELVRSGGHLALSLWQFLDEPTLERKSLDGESALARRLLGEAVRDLEPGDRLIPWGDGSAARYCHHTSDEEASTLVGDLPTVETRRWRSDGRSGQLNLYLELRRA